MRAVFATLRLFASNLIRPKSRLARALVPVLLLKVALVLSARVFVFGGDMRLEVTPAEVERHFSSTEQRTGN